MSATDVVDSRGRRCPLPVVDLARAAAERPPGAVLAVLATDPAAAHDVPAWCRMRGHEHVGTTTDPDGALRISVRLAAAPASTSGAGAPARPPAAPGRPGG